MTNTVNRVIDRIQKLRRLSESQNVHEAAAAAGEAQRLMTEHRIAEAQLQAESGELDEPVTDVDVLAATGSKTPQSWLVHLASGIARANGCRITITSASRRWKTRGEINMYGQPRNLDAAKYLFYAMQNEINRLANDWNATRDDASRAATLSFKLGAAQEIAARMVAEKVSASQALKESADLGLTKATGALTVINRAEEKVDAAVNAASSGTWGCSGPSNYGAYASGKAAGRSVNLGNGGRLGAPAKQIGAR
jgi:hypothetical protein